MNALYTGVKHTSIFRELVLLGVRDYYETYEAISDHNGSFNVKEFNQYPDAYQWLAEVEHQEEKPYVLICSYEFLAQDGFRFLREFRKINELHEVPFFLLKPESTSIKSELLLKMGVNDCFSIPIDWGFLRARISFHHRMMGSSAAQERKNNWQPPLTVNPWKRSFDLVFALSLLILLSPVLLLIGIAIKLESKGPVIYCSKRAGMGYRVFSFYKFRSMYVDADQRLTDLQHLNQYKGEVENCFVKIKNDPRITKVGRIIRKTSLDELPQLFNVLKGDMSVVGNRPLPLYEAKLLTKNEWAYRFLAPAGLTGLWQVTKRGRNEMSTEERVNLDITYAKEHSIWYDFKILFRTLPAMLQHEDV